MKRIEDFLHIMFIIFSIGMLGEEERRLRSEVKTNSQKIPTTLRNFLILFWLFFSLV